MRRNTSQKGFTLIELLIVIAIIGILAAVLIPNLLSARTRAFDTAAQACGRSIATAQEIHAIDNDGSYGATVAALNTAAPDMVQCANVAVTEGDWVGGDWEVKHNNSSQVYTVSPAGIVAQTD